MEENVRHVLLDKEYVEMVDVGLVLPLMALIQLMVDVDHVVLVMVLTR